jgi:phosphoadenylyl-sulfate reductase (thioredoxin)
MLKFDFDKNDLNNEIFLHFKVDQAKYIIKRSSEIFGRELAVAFSGGKDSLVALHLTIQSIGNDVKVIYSHTTVEFPETIRYVKRLADEWNFELIMTKPKSSFFKVVKEVGWATHENRWCCKPYKEEPAYEIINQIGIAAEITGTNRTESIYRRYLKPIMPPKKSPYLIRIHPIYDWNEAEVWEYIRENNLPYNPLYDMGYKRIGCWCCPLNGSSHYKKLRKTHPTLFNFLLKFEPMHPRVAEILGEKTNFSSKVKKPKYFIQPCSEGKEMLHVIFSDKNLGRSIAEKIGAEVHNDGSIICISKNLKGFLEEIIKENEIKFRNN